MTPKEKTKELVGKFMPHIAGADRYNTTLGIYDKDISKQCALIAVDEMIEVCESYVAPYYYEVKKEIEKL
jgi:hypothetical protein